MRKNDTAVPNNGQPQKLKTPWETRKARIGAVAVRLYQREQRACEWHNRNPQTHLARALDRFCDLVERVIGGPA